ncbi:MAG: hypothetical protein LAO20_19340 [Acidobacteriia bacterium]|nr:hypothetical protein [Terriglobia bacterium]
MLKTSQRIVVAAALAAMMLWLAGCRMHTSIADITSDPAKFAGKDITVAGTASDSFGAMGNGIFRVDDGTGSIWVLSQNFGVPGNGVKVTVTGRVEQGFNLGGKSYGVILRQTEDRH